MRKKVVLGVSGGMDSSVLLHKAINHYDDIIAVFFNYNQRHIIEKNCANKQVDHVKLKIAHTQTIEYKTIDVSFIREIAPTSSLTNDNIATPNVKKVMGEAQPLSYVPNRNLMFISILASLAEANNASTIWHGSAQADSLAGYWDSSNEFRNALNSLLSLNRSIQIKVETPLINMSKKDIILEGIKMKVNFGNTYTCYSGNVVADAESVSSSLRIKGFIDAGYIDPIQYRQDLTNIWAKYNCKPVN